MEDNISVSSSDSFHMPLPYNKKDSLEDEPDYIGMVNWLQDKVTSCDNSFQISLPQIVVVGSQCAGKSSTLESIVGREFLPRGTDVVTRRPTIVQLCPCDEEYVTFLHKPEVKFTNFEHVKAEITAETNRHPGPKGFSSKPITLHVYSPDVLKLTLVDLPGIIKVTSDNQSETSPKEIRNMVLDFIKNPNSIILAVTPANMELNNSDALEISKLVDPQGIRTIGVLTKLDLMDEGSNAREILENKKIRLERGYIGVLNRSQKETDDGKDIAYCLEKEENFFATTPCYRDMASRMGIKYLRQTLNEQLYNHIKEYLPTIRKELSQKLTSARKELEHIRDNVNFDVNDTDGIRDYMIRLTQQFTEQLKDVIFGYNLNISMDELSAGTMINYTINKGVQNLKLPQVPSQRKLLNVLANSGGIRNCFTMPSLSLEAVFNQLLNTYIDPLNFLVDDIANILDLTAEDTAQMLNHYPSFRNELLFLVKNCISKAAVETKETLTQHLEAEMYFVNTCHKDFTFPDLEANESLFPIKLWQNSGNSHKSSNAASSSVTDKGRSDKSSTDSGIDANPDQLEAIESIDGDKSAKSSVNVLAKTIENYIVIQHKHIQDISFKYIIFFLVKRVMDFVRKHLLREILKTVDKKIISRDCEKDFNRISELETYCQHLDEALNAIQTF